LLAVPQKKRLRSCFHIQDGLNLIIQEVNLPKITIIGAGSLIFSRQLIWDILSFSQLSGSIISLMDIDKERLNLIAQLAQKMVEDKGWRAKI